MNVARRRNPVLSLGVLLAMLAALLPAFVLGAPPALATDDHLLLCEAVATPTPSEFIEIANPTGAPIDLTNYYLSDDEDYALLPGTSGAGPAPSIGSSDFIAQFPPGATLPALGVVVVAFDGAGFAAAFGFAADYEISPTDATPDMIATNVGATAGLTNGGENAVLFTWDGASDLVTDVDMLNIGTPSSTNDIGDKTGVSVDGPDGDAVASTYALDAFTMPQQAGDPGFGFSTKRLFLEAGNEITGGGNGISGDDETTEQITATWDSTFTAPNPGTCDADSPAPALSPGDLVVNEVDYDQPTPPTSDSAEFVEIKNTTGATIDLSLVDLVLFNGGTGSVYDTIPLAGTLAAGDYFVVCGDATNVANCDLDDGPNTNFIQNGPPDAVAIDFGGTIIDTVSYEGDSAAPYTEGSGTGLEDNAADGVAGISRCADGADTDQNNVDFLGARPITPGATNDCAVGGGLNPGDLVINEIMQNPDAVGDSAGEWFEVFNTTTDPINLLGLEIRDDDFDSHTIASAVMVPAGDYAVLGNNEIVLTNGGVTVDYDYNGSWFLSNGADEVVIVDGTTEIDRVNYDGGATFPDPTGASMALIDTALDNNAGPSWCTSETPFGDGDYGTPGAANICLSDFDLIINEVIQNPDAVSDGSGEWFEVFNPTGAPIDIDGWTIKDNDTDSHVIANGGALLVPAGGYAVLARDDDSGANGGVTAIYEYGTDVSLGNGDDELVLLDGMFLEVDRVEWDGGPAFPDPTGASMSLLVPFLDNNVGSNWCTATTPFGAGDAGTPGAVNDCALTLSFIHNVQGSGSSVAISGLVTVDAIVTSLLEADDALDGFLLQEEVADYDIDPLTSEGILVTCEALCPAGLAVGDNVTVSGDAGELFGMSEIDASGGGIITINSTGNSLPTATSLGLPAPGGTNVEGTFEELEGMLVEFTDELFVSEYFELARFGQVVLTVDERPFQFTHGNTPSVAGYSAFLDDLATRRIVLDDNTNDQNDAIFGPDADEPYLYPEPGFSTSNRFRGGDSITGLTGVLDWAFGEWRVKPTPEVFDYTFTPNNSRSATPDDVGGTLKVASANVLNFFTTIDTGAPVCGPSGTLGCRGAHSPVELDRQRDKIVAALTTIDADVIGLIEIENNADASLIDLVGGLNAVAGAGTYEYVNTGTIGTDAIKVGFIYKPATVSPAGPFAILDSSVDLSFLDTKNRPVLIQTFDEVATGARVTVAVNHLKSKGSSCNDVGDPDGNDGQANCNQTRTDAATALVNHLATDPTGSGDPDFLIIGDLNAYAMEDPISAITGAGYTDLIDSFGGSDSYSFVFDGQLGYLDHALANASLVSQVTGVTEWHINADEVNVLDYNDGVLDPGEQSFERESNAFPIYEANAFRSSDHDPLVVGLQLDTPTDLKYRAITNLDALLPTGHRRTDRRITTAIDRIEKSLDPEWWDSPSEVNTKTVFDRERQAVVQLELVVDSGVAQAGDAQFAIDLLVEADRRLAQNAIDAAMAGGGNATKIAQAQAQMVAAAADVAAGRFNEAVNHYKSAWDKATKAL